MGLESVEFVMEVEDEFGIRIPDSVAEKTVTVGQFVDAVFVLLEEKNKAVLADSSVCQSHRGFNQVRKILMDVTGVERARIRPDTSLDDIFPVWRRQYLWKKVTKALGCPHSISDLIPSKKMQVIEIISMIIAVVSGIYLLTISLLAGLLFLPIYLICLSISHYFHTRFPLNCEKVSDLVCYGRERIKVFQEYSKDDLFHRIKNILVDTWALKPEEITPEARFVQDFGWG